MGNACISSTKVAETAAYKINGDKLGSKYARLHRRLLPQGLRRVRCSLVCDFWLRPRLNTVVAKGANGVLDSRDLRSSFPLSPRRRD